MSRLPRAVVAGGLVAAVLPLGAGAAPAGAADDDGPAYSGYASLATATPVLVEVYEPSIPIPSTPQMEFQFAYSKVEADSGSSLARASFMWPGDAVGEGLKTFGEQLGLPPQLFEKGYPVQVNARYPSDVQEQRDEPFPGTVMRTRAAEGTASAKTGFSPDSELQEDESADDKGGDEGEGGALPGLPGLPELPGLDLGSVADLLIGKTGAQADPVPGMPPGLAALIDFSGYVSTSRATDTGDVVRAKSRAQLGDVRLLGGLVQLSGMRTTATATGDGAKGKPGGKATWGTLSIAGQEFEIGPDGVTAAGNTSPIPGLPDDPAKALEQLGISFRMPEPVRERKGDKVTSTTYGLQVEIDTALLKPVISALPTADLAELLPLPEEAAIVKSLIGAVSSMAPRIVITLGKATAEVETVPPIEPPDIDLGDDPTPPTQEKPEAGGGDKAPTGSGPTTTTPADSGPSSNGTAPPADSGADGTLNDAAPVNAGLPKLFSIPGVLLLGGIALACAVGSWMRRIGALALGAGAPCPHGLDSGLPDLRKA